MTLAMPFCREGRYSLQIRVPDEVDALLHGWCRQSPGATWPEWGGHITLLPIFRPMQPLPALEEAIRLAVLKYGPFRVRLSDVWCRPHLVKPDSCIVFITTHDHEPADMWDMQADLAAAVGPMVRPEWDLLWGMSFRPHISLTTGLPRKQAEDLLRKAGRDGIDVSFWAERVSLMRHDDCPVFLQAREAASFPLIHETPVPAVTQPPRLYPSQGQDSLGTGRVGE